MYLQWGLVSIEGLMIDGEPATAARLLEKGPEDLAREVVSCDQGTVRFERAGKKKLIVAFHFQLGNKAAWSCDVCRKSGLERKRRCGWLGNDDSFDMPDRMGPGTDDAGDLPTSYITSESIALLEEFHAWKLLVGAGAFTICLRALVEAIFVLENELRAESNDGRK